MIGFVETGNIKLGFVRVDSPAAGLFFLY